VYQMAEGKARLRAIEVGKINDAHAQILGGLAEGDTVVLDPSNTVTNGTAIARRSL